MTRNLRLIRLFAMLSLCLAASGVPAQDDDQDVPANASWRPQAPKLEQAPPEVKADHGNFRVERPKASLPTFKRPQGESSPEAGQANPDREALTVEGERHDGAGAAEQPAAVADKAEGGALRESRVESPAKPATVDVPAATRRPITEPVPLPDGTVEPDYPRDALRRGIEGYVELEFTVTAQGGVADVAIVDSEPKGEFEDSVRSAIKRWKFKPATQDGKPVDERVRHRFDFNLDE